MKKSAIGLIALIALSAATTAQQLEVNTAGGSLQGNANNGVFADPSVGTPLNVNISQSFGFRVAGGGNSPYILVLGALAATSSDFGGIFGGQYLDLDQATAQIVGDGFGLAPSALPSSFFFTNGTGASVWSVPANVALDGTTLAMQALVADAAIPPFNLNFTAAFAWSFNNVQTVSGDDQGVLYTFSAPYQLYGTNFAQASFSTNGLICPGTSLSTGFSESTALMLAGSPAARPMLAIMWEDLNMVAPAGVLSVNENSATRTVTASWTNGQYYIAPTGTFGTIVATIQDFTTFTQVTYDYTGFTHATPPSEGIVGISDGNILGAGSLDIQADVATAGAVNVYSNSTMDSYFQNFDGTGTVPIAPFDLAGTVMTIILDPAAGILVF